MENHDRFAAVAGRAFLGDHEVDRCSSVAAARAALGAGEYDAILIDYDLDDGKGTELLPSLLALTRRPYIIAVSAHERGNDLILQAGADAVCPKARFHDLPELLRAVAGADSQRGNSCISCPRALPQAPDKTPRWG